MHGSKDLDNRYVKLVCGQLGIDHRSHIGQVELALEQLGYRLVTSVAKVA